MRLDVYSVSRRTPLLVLLTGFALLHVVALGLFARGFLLTRVELTTRSSCDDVNSHETRFETSQPNTCNCSKVDATAAGGASADSRQTPADCACDELLAGCWSARHFSKTAWVIVDALRFDFVACDGAAASASNCRSRMPQLLDLAQSSVSVGKCYMLIARDVL